MNGNVNVFLTSCLPDDFWKVSKKPELKLLTKEIVVRKVIGIAKKKLVLLGLVMLEKSFFQMENIKFSFMELDV